MASALALTALLLFVAGYAFGARRSHGRERSLRGTIDQQKEKLSLVQHELLRHSNLDPVTDLPTHESFHEFLALEWRRATRDRTPVSVILAEVDHFRAYTDRLGKPQADACLKAVAGALKTPIRRPGDFLARYGPGKFGVILGGAGESGATTLAEKLRQSVAGLELFNPESTTAPHVTLSLGVASVKPDRDSAWQDIELVAAADRGLTEAKEAGRNRVGVERPAPAS